MKKITESELFKWMWLSMFVQLCVGPALSGAITVTVGNIMKNSITVSWGAASKASYYDVHYNEYAKESVVVRDAFGPRVLPNLKSNTCYEIFIAAYKDEKRETVVSTGETAALTADDKGNPGKQVAKCDGTTFSPSMIVVSMMSSVLAALFVM